MTERDEPRELQPCPFCGGKAHKVVSPLGFGNIKAVECIGPTCAVTGPWGRNEAEAIAAWNRRHLLEGADNAEG